MDEFADFGAPSTSTSSQTSTPKPAAVEEAYESVLWIGRECFVYKLPARASTAGYKAGEWGDMEAFLWKGRCRVMETTKGNTSTVVIQLEDSNTGELFAQAPYDKTGKAVEPVLDSSRYFVLRVFDVSSGKHAYLGMGFQERSEAFDFQVALQDWSKWANKRQRAPPPSEAAASSPHIPAGPKRDFSLKEGQTISVKLGGGAQAPSKKAPASSSNGGAIPLLAPPPSASRKR